MRFVMKACMSKISYCDSTLRDGAYVHHSNQITLRTHSGDGF
jgi:hypothetical protein